MLGKAKSMLVAKTATTIDIESERTGIQELLVQFDNEQARAVNYTDLTGVVSPGDDVLVNTTAVQLGLGTGGVHFVIANLSNPAPQAVRTPGHVMKMRYAPHQHSVLSVEEPAGPNRSEIDSFETLDGMPVICCELHSQIAPASAALKALTNDRARIAYIMTDGAALPIAFSRLAAELKQKGLLDSTITCGQAFGGDIEAVNLYTALIAAKSVATADAAIVCQGPGNTGTGTKYGFSGIQQGEAINAARLLGGQPIAVVRMSFADSRERHRGVSHHSLTVLGEVALSPALVAVPELPDEKMRLVSESLENALRWSCHEMRVVNGERGLEELARREINVTTMGRSMEEDREFFLAASAAGVLAAELLCL